jgi:hypothetical protein
MVLHLVQVRNGHHEGAKACQLKGAIKHIDVAVCISEDQIVTTTSGCVRLFLYG